MTFDRRRFFASVLAFFGPKLAPKPPPRGLITLKTPPRFKFDPPPLVVPAPFDIKAMLNRQMDEGEKQYQRAWDSAMSQRPAYIEYDPRHALPVYTRRRTVPDPVTDDATERSYYANVAASREARHTVRPWLTSN